MPSSSRTSGGGTTAAAMKEISFPCCLTPNLSISAASVDHTATRSINNSSTFRYDFATATTSSLYPHTHFTNHESIPRLPELLRSFVRSFPQYLQTAEADHIRAQDYPHLSRFNQICFDYAGYCLFSYTQERDPGPDPTASTAFPSSASAAGDGTNFSRAPSFKLCYTSRGSTSQALESGQASNFEAQFRSRIMQFLNISNDEYSLVFTPNHSSAFKLLAESYPFKTSRTLLTVYDHYNLAVETMIESSRRRGANPVSAEFKWPSLKIHYTHLKNVIVNTKKKKKRSSKRGLLAFPLQSGVSGARYSYQWMNLAQENDWHVLLDATALGPKDMDTLGLSFFKPDFLICSCYKVFGHDPSGFGCLLIKKPNSLPISEDSSSGTPNTGIAHLVTRSPSSGEFHREASTSATPTGVSVPFHEEDGAKYSEPSSSSEIQFKGLDNVDKLGLPLISTRSRYLINWLINAMCSLRHPDSESTRRALITIYGPRVGLERAPILAFNVFDWKGERVDPVLVQNLAGRNNISVGCGFVKHVWFGKRYEVERERVMERRRGEGVANKGKRREKWDYGIHVVTVTIGYLNNFEDVYGLWVFVAKFLDADFVEKERWRYTALNQKTIEVSSEEIL